MKRKWFAILVVTFVFGFASSAFAFGIAPSPLPSRTGYAESSYGEFTNSGSLVGVFEGNNNNPGDFQELVGWLRTEGGYGDSFAMVEYFNDEFEPMQATTSGEWSTAGPIQFYAVKANNAFALYEVPFESSGTWSTYDLWVRGYSGEGGLQISHLTGYNGTTPVPEPATLMLMGTGLLGLAGFGRKKLKK